MARTKTSVEYNNFTGGVITEASPLTFPENASLDESNININKDGSRQRRFGLDWTTTAQATEVSGSTLATSGEATNGYTWKSAGNDGDKTIGVLQRGRVLRFYSLDNGDPASDLIATVTLNTSDCPDPTIPLEFTTANGKLLIAGGGKQVPIFEWTGSALVKSSQTITLKIRDRFGVEDNLNVDARPVTLSNAHKYNLRNQGWPLTTLCASDATGGSGPPSLADPVAFTFTSMGWYPSNADLVWANKLSNISGSAPNDIRNLDTFSPWELEKQFFGTSPSPRGKYLIDIFDRGASRFTQSGVVGLPADSTAGGIAAVSSFAGRIWYSVEETGITGGDERSPQLGNMVFYSVATTDEQKWGSCHTEQDPTEEDLGDVLDSDGGFISIPECGRIYKLVPMGESIYVLASNGVWEIFGGDSGFSATQQSIVKVTDVGALSNRPITAGENVIAYWAESGIYGIVLDPANLRGVAKNITELTIQTYYDDIPLNLKKQARGGYDPISKQVVWLYNLEEKSSEFYFDKEMVFDVPRTAFTFRNFGTIDKAAGEGPYPTTHLKLRNLLQGSQKVLVTSGTITVTASGEDVYTVESKAEQKTKTSLMYWIADNKGVDEDFWLGGYTDFDYVDYPKIEDQYGNFGVDATAYLVTGALTGGDSSRYKYAPYVSVKMLRTESGYTEDVDGNIELIDDSGCLMHALWEWTNSGSSGRWTRPQQVYRLPRFQLFDENFQFNFDVVNTRNKIRGKGRALSLKFASEPGKDMHLLGWGLDVSMKGTI